MLNEVNDSQVEPTNAVGDDNVILNDIGRGAAAPPHHRVQAIVFPRMNPNEIFLSASAPADPDRCKHVAKMPSHSSQVRGRFYEVTANRRLPD
jgi:hypothetical protein